MKTKFFPAAFVGLIVGCVTLSFLPAGRSQSKDVQPQPSLERPVLDTITAPAILERIGEKTEMLKEQTRTIGKNSRANERQAVKLNQMINQIPKSNSCCVTIDVPADTTQAQPIPSRPGFFKRFGRIFSR